MDDREIITIEPGKRGGKRTSGQAWRLPSPERTSTAQRGSMPASSSPLRTSLLSFGFLAGVLLAACSEADESLGFGLSDAAEPVEFWNTEPLVAAPATLREVRRFGSEDGNSEASFYWILALAVDSSGDLYAYDRDRGVKRFGADGEYRGLVAGHGSGPGEVLGVHAITATSDGALIIHDPGNNRLQVLEPEGEIRTITQPLGYRRHGEDALFEDDDGEIWVGVTPPYGGPGIMDFPRPTFVRMRPDGGFADTVWVPEAIKQSCPLLSERAFWSGFFEDRREPFMAKAKWAVGPDGSFALGCPTDYAFELRRPDGTVLRIGRDWTPVRMPSAERDFWLNETPDMTSPFPSLPPERPAYARIILPGDGRVWVWPEQPSEEIPLSDEVKQQFGIERAWGIGSKGAFDMFDYEGRWLGSVQLPESLPYTGYPITAALRIRCDTVWGVTEDSLGVQFVSRMEVEWPGGSAPGGCR
jgi:hypothetical protein